MVNEWYREGWLIARFFFSRDTTETMSTRLFCSTICDAFSSITRDFITHSAEFKARPDWEHLSFEEQYEGLIAAPLRAIGRRAILTIDALDECEDRIKLLEVIRDKQFSIPLFRTFITGRPEADIKRWSEKLDRIRITNFQMLEGYNQDVEKYIRLRLEDMPDIQDRVVHRAEGLFIWARIACDLLVVAADIYGLLKQLEGPLEGDAKLDAIYRVALEQATPKDLPSQRAMVKVLQMILAARTPLSISELEKISPWDKGNVVGRIVTRLGSLLLYENDQDPVRLLHTTLREFLTARQRARIYYIQLEYGHYTLALGSLNYLSDPSSVGTLGLISQR